MRKVTFIINDLEWFRKYYKMSDVQFNDTFGSEKSFKCIYVLYGERECPDRYELTDLDGNKMNINELNGYQKGVVLSDCLAYFVAGKYHSDTEAPCGVVEIKEEEI